MAVSDSIYSLALVDGLPTSVGGKEVRYKSVTLRETNVADERRAAELSERLIRMPTGGYSLIPSEEVYAQAMAMLAVVKFESAGMEPIDQHVLDLNLFGKLSRWDLQAIQERVSLIEAAAQLRHGLISETQFEQMQTAILPKQPPTKQHPGEVTGVGEPSAQPLPAVERLTPRPG